MKTEKFPWFDADGNLQLLERDPVGASAPVDLTGNTPLGWAGKELDGKYLPLFKTSGAYTPNITPVKAPVDLGNTGYGLLLPGDNSILPRSPLVQRSGYMSTNISPLVLRQSKLATSTAPSSSISNILENKCIYFGYSEATGWRPYMEDRVIIQCPLVPVAACNEINSLNPVWYLFGICDGHGGDFTVNYIQKQLPLTILAGCEGLCTRINGDDKKTVISDMLIQACLSVDASLANQGRMRPQDTSKGVSYLDKSGSTALLCLIEDDYIFVANIGDSRGVCGCLTKDVVGAGENDSLLTPTRPKHSTFNLNSVALSIDHKPELPHERERIMAAGAR